MTERILVVDDDLGILDVVRYALESEGFGVETVTDGGSAVEGARTGRFDVLVLDVMLPDISGTEVCRMIRAEEITVPILMLTAKDAEVDRVVGLELGADDYVTKPFSRAELVSRVRAILRRRDMDKPEHGPSVRRVGELCVDLARHEVTVEGRLVSLTPSELKVLALLVERPEHVFTRREIMRQLWQSDHVGDEHAAEVHISNLRRKLERDAQNPERIVTVRGFGYKLVPL
ncbi:MAG TPA: response regulator transcription factor [Gaiellaceae bacterium]|jgi:DNA-binding response OmpR family regulator